MAIPASQIVTVNPRLLTPGGTDLEFNGLVLTKSDYIPSTQRVIPFSSPDDVAAYFGAESDEYRAAVVYFQGYNNSFRKPRALYFARAFDEDAPAFVRGGSFKQLPSITLAELQKINDGDIAVRLGGSALSAHGVDFSHATSLSEVASILDAALSPQTIPADRGRVESGEVDFSGLADLSGGNFYISVDGGEAQHIQGVTFSGTPSLPTIASQLDGLIEGATVSVGNDGFMVASDTVGTASSVSFASAGTDRAASAGVLTGGPIDLSALADISDGAFTILVDGSAVSVSGVSFSGTPTLADVVSALSISGATVAAGASGLVITSSTTGAASSVSYASAPASGTDLSALLGLTEASGAQSVSGQAALVDISGLLGLTQATGATQFAGHDAETPPDTVVVSYSSLHDSFTLTSTLTGESAAAEFATGSLAAPLGLTEATGAVLSPGVDAESEAGCMEAVLDVTQNFVSFSTVWKASQEEALALAQWASGHGVNFLYVMWDNDPRLLVATDTSTIAAALKAANVGATTMVWDSLDYAAMIMGTAASIDWTRRAGTITFAFKSQDGLAANVVQGAKATALKAQNVNFMGDYATRNDDFIFLYPGSMFGAWKWIDTYLNAIWLHNSLQVAIMAGFQNSPRVPYNDEGYTLVRAWCMDPINRALYNGVIDIGITLSESQKAELFREAGEDISDTLDTDGFFLKISDPAPAVRQVRESPEASLWYTYGGSVHRLDMSSTAVV